MEFSADGQLLLAQGGAPDWILTCWNWSKGKAVASIKSPLHVTLHASPSAAMLGSGGLASSASLYGLGADAFGGSHAHGHAPSQLQSQQAQQQSQSQQQQQQQQQQQLQNVVTGCSFSNVDPGLVCVVGVHLVRYFRVLENAFRPMPSPRMDAHVVLCHAWIKQRDDYLVAGTRGGDLLLFHGGEFVSRLVASPGEAHGAVHTLLSTSKGVVAGLDDASVWLYGLNPETAASVERNPAELLVLQRRVRVETYATAVTSVCVSPNEDAVVAATASGQLVTFPYQHQPTGLGGLSNNVTATLTSVGSTAALGLASTDELTNNGLGLSPGSGAVGGVGGAGAGAVVALAKSDDVEFVLSAFHRPNEHGVRHVTGMDVCVRKPILVTCGLDRTVRVWNYLDRSCEVAKQFSEEAHSVSCHPSGLYLLVGFADKLRLMNILMDDIRPFKEFRDQGVSRVPVQHRWSPLRGRERQHDPGLSLLYGRVGREPTRTQRQSTLPLLEQRRLEPDLRRHGRRCVPVGS
ncbi:hypothetical protein PINS_up009031 [Pythium insidiosum]|nr:hypothetical protein PINS_up009031 [Pythium insidiosum]